MSEWSREREIQEEEGNAPVINPVSPLDGAATTEKATVTRANQKIKAQTKTCLKHSLHISEVRSKSQCVHAINQCD